MSQIKWREVGPNVFVQRRKELDLNCGLVVGAKRALVIDTDTTTKRGEELAQSVREITPLELIVVNTHAHYDHCFGNAAFRDSQIYAHAAAATGLRESAERQRSDALNHLNAQGQLQEGEDLQNTEVVLPFYLIEDDITLDLGGREVHLLCGGKAHTDHDLAVSVPDAGVVFWGDMVEQGADPAMEDSYPLEWADTLARLSSRESVAHASVAIPGHGEAVDADFVRAQTEQLRQLAVSLRTSVGNGARDVSALMGQCHGLGLQDKTLRDAAVRTLETLRPATNGSHRRSIPQSR